MPTHGSPRNTKMKKQTQLHPIIPDIHEGSGTRLGGKQDHRKTGGIPTATSVIGYGEVTAQTIIAPIQEWQHSHSRHKVAAILSCVRPLGLPTLPLKIDQRLRFRSTSSARAPFTNTRHLWEPLADGSPRYRLPRSLRWVIQVHLLHAPRDGSWQPRPLYPTATGRTRAMLF